MAIRIVRKTIHLEGHCTVEEALPLLEALRKPGAHKVVLTKCQGLHAAILQVLAAARPAALAPPADPALAGLVMPFLDASRQAAPGAAA
ncbi:hypothetical protein MKK67_05405 [Methylobacterium sp. J-072]|uniref:hypothetical protein n=1 Tax=Methylobacterium sp. J-072 TaxID=2836651 RepID=UPI001FBC0ED3|nr:hypothetical protein [Methylobacterium sp. J-072]MCJ2091945.1 hypothetical protein [Methylobacterium sp. J-072]